MNKRLINSRTGTQIYVGSYPQHTFVTPGVARRNLYPLHQETYINDCSNVDTIIADVSVTPIVSTSLKEDKEEIKEATEQSENKQPVQNDSVTRELPNEIKTSDIEPNLTGGGDKPKFKVFF